MQIYTTSSWLAQPKIAAAVRAHSVPKAGLNGIAILRDVFVVILAMTLAIRSQSVWCYLISIIIIGARQHAFGLLAHEATHGTLFKSKKLNEVAGRLLWWVLFTRLSSYRPRHLKHHGGVNIPDDPDWVRRRTSHQWHFPTTRARLVIILAQDLLGLDALQYIERQRTDAKWRPKNSEKARQGRSETRWWFVFLGALIFTLSALHVWTYFFLLWMVPLFTWLKFIRRLRAIGEHFAIDSKFSVQTRTILATELEEAFVVPYHISYHIEHHYFPTVPWYRLPSLHRTLMTIPEYRAHAVVRKNYVQVLRDCVDPTLQEPHVTVAQA